MVNLLEIEVGQKLKLKTGAIGEVIENMGDGIWVQMRMEDGGDEELVHCEDVAEIVTAS